MEFPNFRTRMQVQANWQLSDCTDAAIKLALAKGYTVEFEYGGSLYLAEPGANCVQCYGPARRPEEWMDLLRARCQFVVESNWDAKSVGKWAASRQSAVLVLGSRSAWLSAIRREMGMWLEEFGYKDYISSLTPRTVDFLNGSLVRFEVKTPSMDCLFGTRYDIAFVEEGMGGNYEPFPWSSVQRERDRWRERQERIEASEQQKMAEYMQVMRDRTAKMQLAISETPQGLRTVRATEQMLEKAVDDLKKKMFEDQERRPATTESKLRIVRDVLLGHFQRQLAVAPSPAAEYADGITAADIKRVVEALGGGSSPTLPSGWEFGIDYAAVSTDGSKIVLTGEKAFESGVIFDPSNRPIRKFKLREVTEG